MNLPHELVVLLTAQSLRSSRHRLAVSWIDRRQLNMRLEATQTAVRETRAVLHLTDQTIVVLQSTLIGFVRDSEAIQAHGDQQPRDPADPDTA